MFGRATIRLGIGPHSSCISFVVVYQMFASKQMIMMMMMINEVGDLKFVAKDV